MAKDASSVIKNTTRPRTKTAQRATSDKATASAKPSTKAKPAKEPADKAVPAKGKADKAKAAKAQATGTAVRASQAKPSKAKASKTPAPAPIAQDTARKRPATPKSHAAARAMAPDRPVYAPEVVAEMFRRWQEINPEPVTELESVNAFTLLVAVVLSAQATDAGVNKATRRLFELADTPQKMLDLGEDRVRDLIKTIGLYRNKAKNTILLSQRLVELHGGEVPRDREALQALPGVGRKTANVILNAAFGEPTMAVDTHIFRISNRIGLAPGKTPEAVEESLLQVIPDAYKRHAHHWLILHGRYVCKAVKPECGRCVISDLCVSKEKEEKPGGVG